MLGGIDLVARLLRANPGSPELNRLWVQIWLQFGSPTDIKVSIKGLASRVRDEKLIALMEMYSLMALGKRIEAVRVGQRYPDDPEITGIVMQQEVDRKSVV